MIVVLWFVDVITGDTHIQIKMATDPVINFEIIIITHSVIK